MTAGTVHPNPDAVDIPADELARLLEELRQAAAAALDVLDGVGVLPMVTSEPLARLRSAVAATPSATIVVPFGELAPDGWVVTPAGRAR